MRVGIAGYGVVGKTRHISIEKNTPFQIIAVSESNKETQKDIPAGIEIFEHYQDLIADAELDIIFISLPNKFAAGATLLSLQKGLHVFCEKPPAINSEQMLEVLRMEKKSGKILKYGFNHRFHYSVIEAKKMIDEGSLGKLLWMRGIYGKAGSIDYHDNWRNYKNYSGGGILFDQGIHMLDLFRYFTGNEFQCLSAYLSSSFWKVECEDNAFVTLKSSESVLATLHSSATQWRHKFLLEMTFEDGYLNLDGILSATRSYAPETLIYGRREFEDITFAMGKPKESTVYFESDKSWSLELLEFIHAVRGDSKIVNGSSNDAKEIMKLTDSIYAVAEKF